MELIIFDNYTGSVRIYIKYGFTVTYSSSSLLGSSLMMGNKGSLSTPCSCFSLNSFWRRTSWWRSLNLDQKMFFLLFTHIKPNRRWHILVLLNRRQFKVEDDTPGSGHVDPDLLQQTLPVTDIQVGSSGPDLCLDVQVQGLQLTVRFPFEHSLNIGADGRVDALTTIAWRKNKNMKQISLNLDACIFLFIYTAPCRMWRAHRDLSKATCCCNFCKEWLYIVLNLMGWMIMHTEVFCYFVFYIKTK